MDMTTVYERVPGFVEKKVGDEMILVPISNQVAQMSEVFTLNDLGAFLLDQLDGHISLGDLVNRVIINYDVDEQTVVSDVDDFVNVALVKGVIRVVQL